MAAVTPRKTAVAFMAVALLMALVAASMLALSPGGGRGGGAGKRVVLEDTLIDKVSHERD